MSRNKMSDKDNIVVSCPKCNLRKGAKHPDKFIEQIENNN